MMKKQTDMNATNGAISQHPDYKAQIAGLVRSNLAPKLMHERITDFHENDIAAAMETLRPEERSRLYRVLDAETLAGVLEYSDSLSERIGELSIRKRVEVLSQLEPAKASDYLAGLTKAERGVLMELMDEETRRGITLLNSFDDDEIGSRLTTNFVAVRGGSSVRQAMRELIDQAAENDNISTVYVVDDEDTLMGAIDLKDLIIARENTALDDITMTSYPYVYANEQIDDCIERMKGYSEDSIPVLDAYNKLKGVLTAQDVTELVDDEMREDYARLAGLSAEEDLNEPLRMSISKRLPWLVVLLGLGLGVSSVVSLFQEVAARLTIIVCFQSLILDMAGNVGTQSLAVTIRVLMDGQLSGKQKFFLIAKEARVGLCNGVILGVISLLAIGGYLLLRGESAAFAFSVALCTGAALMISMLLSGVSGTAIPIAFKKLNIDPAVASGPLITTINDLVAVVTYYGLAWILLLNTLHF